MELNVAGRLPDGPSAQDPVRTGTRIPTQGWSPSEERTQVQPQAQTQVQPRVQTQVQPEVRVDIQAPVAGADPDGPVFVDESGRRGKNLRRLGWVFGLACTCYAVMLVGSLLGGSSRAPWLGIPGPAAKEKKTETVQVTPAPTESHTPRPATVRPGVPAKSRTHPSATGSGRPKASGTPKPAKSSHPAKPATASPRPRTSQTAKPTGGHSAGPGLPTASSGSPTGLSTKPTPPSGAST
ncbi:hypothetical protein AB0M57_18400 [Streptomyces sp. NPDC051597]|uniref:hypothetical protein n=1 Tax=Streptomyces sp. NPDC051597 TaxID=3155049 RepID=UPI00343F92B7